MLTGLLHRRRSSTATPTPTPIPGPSPSPSTPFDDVGNKSHPSHRPPNQVARGTTPTRMHSSSSSISSLRRKKSLTHSDHEGETASDGDHQHGHHHPSSSSSFGRKSRSLFRLGFGRSSKEKEKSGSSSSNNNNNAARSRSPSPYAGRRSAGGGTLQQQQRARSPSTERERGGATSDHGAHGGGGGGGGATTDSEGDEGGHGHSLRASTSSSTTTRGSRRLYGANTSESDLSEPDHAHARAHHQQHRHALDSEDDDTDDDDDDDHHGDGEDDDYDDDDDDDDDDDMDPTLLANTEANAGKHSAQEYLLSQPGLLANPEGDAALDGPNLVKLPASPFAINTSSANSGRTGAGNLSSTPTTYTSSPTSPGPPSSTSTTTPQQPPQPGRMKRRKSTLKPEIALQATRPIYERNRCTITLTHGDPDHHLEHLASSGSQKARKRKVYVVASDLSEESYYAIEWAIGTVLRNGDELLYVTVMETDSKLDPDDNSQAHDKSAKIRNQQERQTRVLQLSREATALLERTRLHVRVHCQAIHAKNARHMLIDLIDYIQPVLVIIGSRGLSKLKGIILGSVSHYLIQKSSSPVMVTRKRLRPLNTRPRRPISDLQRQPRVGGLENATIDKESHGAMVPSHEQKMAAAGTGSGTAAAQSTRTAGGSDAATDSLNSSATALAITDSTEDVNART